MKKVKIKKVKDHEMIQAENYLRLEKRVDVLEQKIDKLTEMMETHIDFIDNYEPELLLSSDSIIFTKASFETLRGYANV